MPELPEVETTKRGITPHLLKQRITAITVRNAKLRWPIPGALAKKLSQQVIENITRRGKYLLIHSAGGTIICHLGMSGCLRIVDINTPLMKHDHVDIQLGNQRILRFNDPRRFGAILLANDPHTHPLLIHLGPEPLGRQFNGQYLFQHSRQRKNAVKNFIMDNKIVVGIGNIYASEALFSAGIRPQTPAGKISQLRYNHLVRAIKHILRKAIRAGGTTIRDFYASDGKPGYFKQQLNVYGRAGLACKTCKKTLKNLPLGQRNTVYCPKCQY